MAGVAPSEPSSWTSAPITTWSGTTTMPRLSASSGERLAVESVTTTTGMDARLTRHLCRRHECFDSAEQLPEPGREPVGVAVAGQEPGMALREDRHLAAQPGRDRE